MRAFLTAAAFFCFTCANAFAGVLLIGELSSALIGQYVAVIAFLAGVAGVLAKIIQSLYQKIIDDRDARITLLEQQLSEARKQNERRRENDS